MGGDGRGLQAENQKLASGLQPQWCSSGEKGDDREARHSMYTQLQRVPGGHQAMALYQEALRCVADTGLDAPDTANYDDGLGRHAGRSQRSSGKRTEENASGDSVGVSMTPDVVHTVPLRPGDLDRQLW